MGMLGNRHVARWAGRLLQKPLLGHPDALHNLMGQALRLRAGQISDEDFRRQLDFYFRELDRHRLVEDIGFPEKAERLNRPQGYKSEIMELRDDRALSHWRRRFSIWGRRFGILRHHGFRADVLILRHGEQVPPHGHRRVVSGFYVLEGRVAIRHFDRVQEDGPMVWVRKVLDATLDPGEFTTNSEFHHNIHWLYGLAPVSFLFRVTVTGTPTATFGTAGDAADERIYLDPSGGPDSRGLIAAPYVDHDAAAKVAFFQESSDPLALAHRDVIR